MTRKCRWHEGCDRDAYQSKVPGLVFSLCQAHVRRLSWSPAVERARAGTLPTSIVGGVRT